MLMPKPTFYRIAQDAVNELAKEGIVCTPEEIVWLNSAAEKVVKPTKSDEILFLHLPIACGNSFLWHLSIGARIWLEQYGKPWFIGSGDMEQLVMAYALAHSRQPEVFAGLTSRMVARLKIVLWACKLNATKQELSVAIAICMGDDEDMVEIKSPKSKVEPEGNASDYGDCIALLCHFYGESPDYWLWKASEQECAQMINKIMNLLPKDKEIKADSPRFTNFSTFRLVVQHIREAHKKA